MVNANQFVVLTGLDGREFGVNVSQVKSFAADAQGIVYVRLVNQTGDTAVKGSIADLCRLLSQSGATVAAPLAPTTAPKNRKVRAIEDVAHAVESAEARATA